MNLLKVCKLSLLPAMLLSPAVYGQFSASAVSPASNLQAGYYRPHVWMASSNQPFAHGPGQSNATCVSSGCYYYPNDIRTAYATSSIANGNGGQGITVAIVDAFYNPQTAADLAAFLVQFPRAVSCTVTPTLTIVNQTGGAPSAGLDSGWALETDLDVQWVTAIAPCANILLVTATNDSGANLYTAEQYAYAHANVVSNSWGSSEFSTETSVDSAFLAGTTVPILVSAGDTGAQLEYPCTSPYVTCVGGTRLLETATSFRNLESVWGGLTNDGGTGGGCSVYESQPAYQIGYSNAGPGGVCGSARGVPDIAALADPDTGVLVYLGSNVCGGFGSESNEPTCTPNNFYVIGGTSLACPISAAMIANIDAARVAASKLPLGINLNTLLYQAATLYHYRYWDITTGSSGFAATAIWDRATGLGVPLGPGLSTFLVGTP
jgi:subtilase family serine protease